MHETISEIENLIVQKKKSYIVAVNVKCYTNVVTVVANKI